MVRKIDEKPHEDEPEYATGPDDYLWYEMTILSRWESPNKYQVLCIDVPSDLPSDLQKALAEREDPIDFADPFALQADLWDRIVVYSDISVWRVRDPVRRLEKERLQGRLHPGDVFVPTHEFSRHAMHVSEVLEAAVGTISAINRCRVEVHACIPELSETYKCQTAEYARFQISLLENMKRRSDSNLARLATEITFVSSPNGHHCSFSRDDKLYLVYRAVCLPN